MEPENKENLESLNKEQPNQIISQGEHELQNNSESKQNIEAESKTEQLNPGTGYGIAALVFGIISIVFLYCIIISVLSAILAIVFGFQASRKGDKGIGKAGLTLGIISVIITFLLFLFLQVLDVSLFTIPSWYR